MQSTINITWVKDSTFIGTDSTNHSVVISSGEDGVGMKPSELLMVSLASCSAVDVVGILKKKRANITDVQISVDGERASDGDFPRPFTKLHVHYKVTGFGLKDADVKRAVELSEEKYCGVAATIRPGVAITHSYEVFEAELETT